MTSRPTYRFVILRQHLNADHAFPLTPKSLDQRLRDVTPGPYATLAAILDSCGLRGISRFEILHQYPGAEHDEPTAGPLVRDLLHNIRTPRTAMEPVLQRWAEPNATGPPVDCPSAGSRQLNNKGVPACAS